MKQEKDIFDYLKKREINTPDERYFADMASKIIQDQAPKVIPLYRRPVFWVSSAAAAIAIVFLFNMGEVPTTETAVVAWNDVSQEEAFTYIDENIEEFDIELIAEAVPVDNIEAAPIITIEKNEEVVEEPLDLEFDDIDSEDILDYLYHEGIELDDASESLFLLN